MLSRKAGRAQTLTAAGKFETPSPIPLVLPNLSPAHRTPEQQEGRQSTGPASPDSSTCEGSIPHSCYQTLHLPLPSKVQRSHCPRTAWRNGSPVQSPQEVYCCHHQETHSLLQTGSQEAEARVPFFTVRSLSTQQPLPPQALTSQHQHCSFSFTARGRTQHHLCCRQDCSRHFLCRATRHLHASLCWQ